MKAATIFSFVLGLFIVPFPLAPHFLSPLPAQAQDDGYQEPKAIYSREELAQMLAPIALYPDALLSQVLMASTYPIEVVEADRWIGKNKRLKGEALDAALVDKEWSPSVKAICHFPSILALMSERISETTDLGNAFLAQETEVMDTVQELRAKAHAQGNLTSNPNQKVIVERETIIIAPADPRVIYVPYYDPYHVYGPWWYPAYPPYYWGPSGGSVSVGFSFWPGIHFGFIFGDWSYFDWHHRHIYIDVHKRPRFVRHDRWRETPGYWQHDARHRRGIAYPDAHTAEKYGQSSPRSGDFRRDTRGRTEQREHDGQGNERPRSEQRKSGDDRKGVESGRQERERVEREKQERHRIERDRPDSVRGEREKQERPRVEGGRQKEEGLEESGRRQMRQQPDQRGPVQERVEEQSKQKRQKFEQEKQEQERLERESSEGGRGSRQERGGNSRDNSPSESDDRGGNHNDRGRSRW